MSLRRPPPRFDHPDLVDREPLTWARFVATFDRMRRDNGPYELDLVHDDDRTCCGREPWSETLSRAIDELKRDGIL